MLSNDAFLRAPSIRLRLPAKRVRVLMFIFCVFIIGYFSWQSVGSKWSAIVFWSWVFVNTFAWGWESWHLIRRGPAILKSSESAVQNRYRTRVGIFWLVVSANFVLMLSVGNSTSDQAGMTTLMVILYNLFTA